MSDEPIVTTSDDEQAKPVDTTEVVEPATEYEFPWQDPNYVWPTRKPRQQLTEEQKKEKRKLYSRAYNAAHRDKINEISKRSHAKARAAAAANETIIQQLLAERAQLLAKISELENNDQQ